MKLRRLASFAAASAIIIGLLGQGASAVLAADNTQYWQGNGVTNGELDNVDCSGGPGMLWIWTGTGDNVWISVDGELVEGDQQGNGAFHFVTSWHDLAGLTAGDGGNVFVTYDGDVDGNAVVTLSHGCEGETSTTTSSSSSTTTTTSSSSTTTTTTSATTTTSSSSSTTTTTSFSQSQQGETDVPTEPNTAAIETGGPSNPGGSAWMLIVALGLLLGSVVILTPAPSKSKR